MIEFTYNIVNLERQAETGGVTIAHWSATAKKDDHSAYTYGSVSLTPDPESETFVPFEDLTEEQVINWVKEALDVESIESGLTGQIELLENPPVLSGVPWTSDLA